MNKNFVKTIGLILITLIFTANITSGITLSKVCYVNLQALLEVHPASRSAIAEMNRVRQKYKKQIKTLEKEVRQLEKKAQSSGSSMSSNDLRELLTKLEAKKEALNDEISRRNKELSKLQRQKLQPVYEQILKDIKRYAESLGYNIVIDSRFVLIGTPELDLTEALKRIFKNRR